MRNRKPVVISFLSQIILVLFLLWIDNPSFRWFFLALLMVSELLLFISLIDERRWRFIEWYSFVCFGVVAFFMVISILLPESTLRTPFSVEIIATLLLGTFLIRFSPKERVLPKVEVTEIEKPELDVVDYSEKKKKAKKALYVSTKRSKKYHKPTCRLMSVVPKNEINMYTSRRAANNKGLTACKICLK